MNEANLIHLNALFLLQSLFDRQNLVFWFKVEGLLSSCQCLDENLDQQESFASSEREEFERAKERELKKLLAYCNILCCFPK